MVTTFETACELTLETGVVTGSIVLNEIRRLTEPAQSEELNGCHHLQLNEEPKADFQRYDHLLGARNVHRCQPWKAKRGLVVRDRRR